MREAFDPSHLTALVLDENAFQRQLTIEQLRGLGFGRTLGAGSAEEAWNLLRASNPDVVLIEWISGAGDGLDFVRRIRQSEEAPNRAASIFMLTSRGALGEVETARSAGVDGYLRKPISGLALQRRVRKAVAKPQPFVTTSSYVGPCRRRPRPSLAYGGPWRRLEDSAVIDHDAAPEETDVKAQLARASVAALDAAARAMAPGDANAARAVFRAAQSLIAVAEQIADAHLTLGAREMARYVHAQGATDKLDPEVVRLHVAALQQLAQLPLTFVGERRQVAESLKRMVDKKLRQGANAA